MTEPLFSIITTTENNAAGLKLTGKSMLQQFDAPYFEWIIIDNNSYDHTQDLIREWDRDFIRFISKPVPYTTHAMNIGLSMATGRFIWFLPSGDCLSDLYVLRDIMREVRHNLKADIIYGDARDNGIIHKARDFSSLMQRPIVPFQSMLYGRKIVGDLRFDTTFDHGADYDFTLRVQEKADYVHYMPRLLCDIDTSQQKRELLQQKLRTYHAIRAQTLNIPAWKNTALLYWHLLQEKLSAKKL